MHVCCDLFEYFVSSYKRKEPTNWYYLSTLFVSLVSFLPSILKPPSFPPSCPLLSHHIKPSIWSFFSLLLLYWCRLAPVRWDWDDYCRGMAIQVYMFITVQCSICPWGEEEIFFSLFISCMMLSTVNFHLRSNSLVWSFLVLLNGMSMLVLFIVIEANKRQVQLWINRIIMICLAPFHLTLDQRRSRQ